MRSILWCVVVWLTVPTSTVSAQLLRPTYQVPCQKRSELVSRLRGLVGDPDHIELDMLSFSVSAMPHQAAATDTWTLTVTRAGSDAPGRMTRVLNGASCEAVVEAAALVIALWIDEQPPQRPTSAQATPPPIAAASTDPPKTRAAPASTRQRGVRVGASLLADGALQLSHDASAGASIELWTRFPRLGLEVALGLRWWISHLGWKPPAASTVLPGVLSTAQDSTAGEMPNIPPAYELSIVINWYLVHLGSLHVGPHFTFSPGWQTAVAQEPAETVRAGLGIAALWELGERLGIVLRVSLGGNALLFVPSATAGVSFMVL